MEEEPLRGQIFLGGIFEAELALFVVVFDEVLNDGAALEELDSGIGILNGRGTVRREKRLRLAVCIELRASFEWDRTGHWG